MHTLEGEFCGVECINGEGKKQSFGNKGVLLLGNDLDKSALIYVVEGWADGAGVMSMTTNTLIFVAFGLGRIDTVASFLDELSPDRQIITLKDIPR
jgi:phage/plasmid primase-like uncharacterized protein